MASTVVWHCDRHLTLDPPVQVLGTPVILGIGGRWQSVDLCPECHDEILALAISVWAQFGITVDGPVPRGVRSHKGGRRPSLPTGLPQLPLSEYPEEQKMYPCPWCSASYSASNGLTAHATEQHGVESPGDRKSIFDGYDCPICGGPYKSLGNHTAAKHGGLTSAQAFQTAGLEGDPHGVVRDLLGKAQSLPGGFVIGAVA